MLDSICKYLETLHYYSKQLGLLFCFCLEALSIFNVMLVLDKASGSFSSFYALLSSTAPKNLLQKSGRMHP